MSEKETPSERSTSSEDSTRPPARGKRASSGEPESSARGTRRAAKTSPTSKSEAVGPAKKPRPGPSYEPKKETTTERKSASTVFKRGKEGVAGIPIPGGSSGKTTKTAVHEAAGSSSHLQKDSAIQAEQRSTGHAQQLASKTPSVEVTASKEISGKSEKTVSPSEERKVAEGSSMEVEPQESEASKTPALLKSGGSTSSTSGFQSDYCVTKEPKHTLAGLKPAVAVLESQSTQENVAPTVQGPSVGAVPCSSPPKKSPQSSDESDSGKIGATASESVATRFSSEDMPSSSGQSYSETLSETPSSLSLSSSKATQLSSESDSAANILGRYIHSSFKVSLDLLKLADKPDPKLPKHLEAGKPTADMPENVEMDEDEQVPLPTDQLFVSFNTVLRVFAGDPSVKLKLAGSRKPPPSDMPTEPSEELYVWDGEPCGFHKSVLSPSVREPRPLGSWPSEYPEMTGGTYPICEWQEPQEIKEPLATPEVTNDVLRKMGLFHAQVTMEEKAPKKIKKSKYVVTPEAGLFRYIPSPVYTAMLCDVPARASYDDVSAVFSNLDIHDVYMLFKKEDFWVVDFLSERSLDELMRNYDDINIFEFETHVIFVGLTNEKSDDAVAGGSGTRAPRRNQRMYHASIAGVPMDVSRERIRRDLKAQGFNNVQSIHLGVPAQGTTTADLTITYKALAGNSAEDEAVLEIADKLVKLRIVDQYDADDI